MKPVVLLTVLLLAQYTTADLLDGLEHHHGEHHDGEHHEHHDGEHHEHDDEHHGENHEHDDEHNGEHHGEHEPIAGQDPLGPLATSLELDIPGAATASPDFDYDAVQSSSNDYFSTQSDDESPAAPGGEAKQLGALDPNPASAVGYPQYAAVPETSFACSTQQFGGYFADPEAECQVFHICLNGRKMGSFLCPNGTLFHQRYFVCDWWYNVDCSASVEGYQLNANIGVVPE